MVKVYPGARCGLVHATEDSLLCERYLLVPLTGNYEGSMVFMVLRGRPTPTRFPLFLPRGTQHPCILYHVCDACGANDYFKGFLFNPDYVLEEEQLSCSKRS